MNRAQSGIQAGSAQNPNSQFRGIEFYYWAYLLKLDVPRQLVSKNVLE